jgi:hypothetical protein
MAVPLFFEDALVVFHASFAELLGFLGFVGRNLQVGRHFLPDQRERQPGLLGFLCKPFFLNDAQDRDDVDKIVLICTTDKCGHGKVGSIWHLDLDLSPFPFLD